MNLEINKCNWEFLCPQKWEKLTPTAHDAVRHCSECSQFVFLCETEDDLLYHARRRHCVALPPSDEEEWVVMGRYALPPYNGARMTLKLEPTSKLDREQLEFLMRSFELSKTDYQLRVDLCDGQARVLGRGLHPDIAEELSRKMSDRGILHQLTVDPAQVNE
jgi:hypothetical protein